MSVVDPIEPLALPPILPKATVRPPVVIKLPLASFAVKVRVDVAPELIDADETLTKD